MAYWYFPSNDYGENKGINDSGVATFRGTPLKSLAREICQNSLDAATDKTVRVDFANYEIPTSDVPGAEVLKETFEKCLAYWNGQKAKTTKDLFKNAFEKISAEKISILRISDFMTKGLTGSKKTADINTDWMRLTKSSGSSDKKGPAGGSFGIGKFAPFACSDLFTVFYNTYAYEKKNSSEQLKKIRNDGIAALKQICNIEYLDDSIFKSISKEHVNIYFKYRAANNREHGGTIDHGIIGGLILYDRLRKQFEISWKKRINKNDDRTSFYVIGADNRKLHLSNSHFVAYAKVADSIIRHSIFNETLNCYIKEEKTNIPLFNEKISIDNKLGFVLGIADTLEPLKRNHKYLDSVSLETIKEPPGIRICIKEEDYNKLYSKIEELKDWISVNIKIFKEESNIIVEITGNTN